MNRRALALPALFAAAALALAACSPGAEEDADTAASSDTESAAPAAEETTEEDCKEVEDANGTVCVPVDPQRIVVLDPLMSLPTLLSVDAPIVGATSVYADGISFPDYLDPADLEGIEVVGAMQDPNLEAIAALKPDLIIGDSSGTAAPYADRLSTIAPVVSAPYSFYRSTWIDDVRFIADVVGKAEVVEKEIADYEEHAAEVAEALSAAAPTLSRVDIYEGTPLYYRSGCTWFGTVLSDAGVSQPASQTPTECTEGDYQSTIVYLSPEELSILDADVIVTYQQQSTGSTVGVNPLDDLAGNQLWDNLPAVQNDDVHVMGDAWGLGVSLQAAHTILDDLEEFFPAS